MNDIIGQICYINVLKGIYINGHNTIYFWANWLIGQTKSNSPLMRFGIRLPHSMKTLWQMKIRN